MTVARAPWSSSLQRPILAASLVLTTTAGLLFNALTPGPWATVLLTAAGLATLWLGYAEYRHFRSISQAYQLAMQAAHDGFWNWNPLTKKLQVGSRLLQILGYREDFLPDTSAWLRLVHPDDRGFYNAEVARHLKGESGHFYCEYRVLASDGQYRWIASRGLAVRDGQGRAYLMVGSVTDITERHRHQEELEFLAQHDILTGLPNRLLFTEHLKEAINNARQRQQRLAVLFIDLDRFKNINDGLGHRAGDQMLQAVSTTLRARLPTGCRLYRQGGDEFIVLSGPLNDENDAVAIALSLKECITEPIKGSSSDFFTSASIGVSLFPDDADDGETLLRHADTAMYAAKAAGGNAIRLHTPQMDQRVSQRVSLENRLRQALQEDRLSLHFQAKVDADNGRLLGAEALLRWPDGDTMIPPDQFIPVAEECGLIVPIGEWVIARAISQIAEWRHRHPRVPPIAINLSPRQFWRPSLAQGMLDALATAGLPTSVLEVEITESVVLDPEGDGIEQLNRLRAAGIGVALDDFGTGYSSLSYLQRLPINVLKIDRSFIRALASEPGEGDSEPLVRAIIAMAHSLSLQVVAEGVETPTQLQMLQALNCDIIQGYLVSRPLPPGQFAEKFLVDRDID